jgi:hypothetical protein
VTGLRFAATDALDALTCTVGPADQPRFRFAFRLGVQALLGPTFDHLCPGLLEWMHAKLSQCDLGLAIPLARVDHHSELRLLSPTAPVLTGLRCSETDWARISSRVRVPRHEPGILHTRTRPALRPLRLRSLRLGLCRLLMLRFDCPNLFGCPNSLRFSKFVSVVQIRFPPQVIHDGGDRSSSSVVAERSSP